MPKKSLSPRQKHQLRQLGLAVQYYRKLKSLTQEEVAERAGISRTHLSNFESAGSDGCLSLPTLLSIADALEVEPADLFLLHTDLTYEEHMDQTKGKSEQRLKSTSPHAKLS